MTDDEVAVAPDPDAPRPAVERHILEDDAWRHVAHEDTDRRRQPPTGDSDDRRAFGHAPD
jgi:hypothetical protein